MGRAVAAPLQENAIDPRTGVSMGAPLRIEQHLNGLESVRDALLEVGLPMPHAARIPAHLRALRRAHEKGIPTDPEALRQLGWAIRDARELGLVLSAFERLAEPLKAEFRRLLGGTAGRGEPTREPYQFQAQFLMGAFLAGSGVSVQVPTGKGPDFIVHRGGEFRYGLEVKAPSGSNGLAACLKKASKQLRQAGISGVVAVDVSEVIELTPVPPRLETDDELKAEIRTQVSDVTRKIVHLLTGGGSTQVRRRHQGIISLFVAYRGYRWHRDESGELSGSVRFPV